MSGCAAKFKQKYSLRPTPRSTLASQLSSMASVYCVFAFYVVDVVWLFVWLPFVFCLFVCLCACDVFVFVSLFVCVFVCLFLKWIRHERAQDPKHLRGQHKCNKLR